MCNALIARESTHILDTIKKRRHEFELIENKIVLVENGRKKKKRKKEWKGESMLSKYIHIEIGRVLLLMKVLSVCIL